MKKNLGSIALALAIFVLANSTARASEGTVELRNTVGSDARCFATSVLMEDLNYNILVSCRDILYPGGTEVFSYVTWASPTDGSNPVKLGTLDLGKVVFETKKPFLSLFVTKEIDSRVRSPQGQVVMQGSVKQIELLENPNSIVKEEPDMIEPTVTPSPKPKSSIINVFRLGGVAAAVLLVLVIGLVFVLTRE